MAHHNNIKKLPQLHPKKFPMARTMQSYAGTRDSRSYGTLQLRGVTNVISRAWVPQINRKNEPRTVWRGVMFIFTIAEFFWVQQG